MSTQMYTSEDRNEGGDRQFPFAQLRALVRQTECNCHDQKGNRWRPGE